MDRTREMANTGNHYVAMLNIGSAIFFCDDGLKLAFFKDETLLGNYAYDKVTGRR